MNQPRPQPQPRPPVTLHPQGENTHLPASTQSAVKYGSAYDNPVEVSLMIREKNADKAIWALNAEYERVLAQLRALVDLEGGKR